MLYYTAKNGDALFDTKAVEFKSNLLLKMCRYVKLRVCLNTVYFIETIKLLLDKGKS